MQVILKNIKNVIEKENKSLNHRHKLLKTDLSNQTHTTDALNWLIQL